MDRVSRVRIVTFEEHADTHDLKVIHSSGQGGTASLRQILAPQKDINVLRGPHGGRILRGDPESHGLTANQGMRNSGFFQSLRYPLKPFADLVHGHHVLLPGTQWAS